MGRCIFRSRSSANEVIFVKKNKGGFKEKLYCVFWSFIFPIGGLLLLKALL